jgi:hypothetical protein
MRIGVTPEGHNIEYGDDAVRTALGTSLTPLTQFVRTDGARFVFINGVWIQTHAVGGASLVTTSGYVPDAGVTGKNRFITDCPAYANFATLGVVNAADVERVEWTEAEKVTAIRIDGWGGANFKALILTLNKTAGAEEEAALRLLDAKTTPTTENDNDIFIIGKPGIFYPITGGYITSVSMTAIDSDGSEDNNIIISAY